MRGFGWFSNPELAQIALQPAIPVEIPITYANFGGFPQRCHSDVALTRVTPLSLSDSRFMRQQCQRVIGRHDRRVLVLPGQSELDERVTARQIEYRGHANAK
jgi:hypothetical protein